MEPMGTHTLACEGKQLSTGITFKDSYSGSEEKNNTI